MKITLNGFVNWQKPYSDESHGFSFNRHEMTEFGYTTVCPATIEVEVPDNFNPITGLLQVLDNKEKYVRAAYTVAMFNIETERAKLLCLELTPATSTAEEGAL